MELSTPSTKNKELVIDDSTKIKLYYDDKTIIFNIIQNIIPKKEYESNFTLEQLYKVNKYFINFDNINELVDNLLNSIKNKKSIIIFKEKECFIQILNSITNKAFDLPINMKEKNTIDRIKDLEEIISQQSTMISQQNTKIAFLEEKIKQFEPMFEEYLNKKKEEKEEKEKMKKMFEESQILNENEKKLLIEWLPYKPKDINLLMNSKIDGYTTKVIQNKCAGKKPTYAIIKTKKGYKFGGYTTKLWEGGQIKDDNAFVFSLNKKKKYSILKPEYALGFDINSWWGFGYSYNAIVINDDSNSGNYVGNGTYDIPEKNELNGGERNFTVKSFEIYQVEY